MVVLPRAPCHCRDAFVQVFNEAIRKGLECKEKPPDDFFVRRCTRRWLGANAA